MPSKNAAQQSVHLTGGITKRQCALARRCSLEAHSSDVRSELELGKIPGLWKGNPQKNGNNRLILYF